MKRLLNVEGGGPVAWQSRQGLLAAAERWFHGPAYRCKVSVGPAESGRMRTCTPPLVPCTVETCAAARAPSFARPASRSQLLRRRRQSTAGCAVGLRARKLQPATDGIAPVRQLAAVSCCGGGASNSTRLLGVGPSWVDRVSALMHTMRWGVVSPLFQSGRVGGHPAQAAAGPARLGPTSRRRDCQSAAPPST